MKITRVAAVLLLVAPTVAAQTAREGVAAARPKVGKASARAFGRVPAAAAPARAEGDVDRIFERFVEAQGGLAAMLKVRTRVMRGYAEHSKSNVPGKVEYYSKAPNKVLNVIEVPGAGQFIESYDGRDSWFHSPFTGAFTADQTSVVILTHGAEFGRVPKAHEMYASVKYLGRAAVGGRDAHLIEAVRGKHPQRLYFDAASGLMVRADVVFVSPNKETASVSIYYDKYAKVDGLMIPVVLRQVFPDFTMTFKIYEVKHNVPLEDALFESPKGSRPYQAPAP